jgi:hypothetical protein
MQFAGCSNDSIEPERFLEHPRDARFTRDIDPDIAATSSGSDNFMLFAEFSFDRTADSAVSSHQ